jgi:hypothetical protein
MAMDFRGGAMLSSHRGCVGTRREGDKPVPQSGKLAAILVADVVGYSRLSGAGAVFRFCLRPVCVALSLKGPVGVDLTLPQMRMDFFFRSGSCPDDRSREIKRSSIPSGPCRLDVPATHAL